MRLCAIFLLLNIQLGHIFASPPSPLELSSQAKQDQKGYECGNVFFSDDEVNEALSLGLDSLDKGNLFPQLYRGPLYSESKIKEYLLYPIKKGQQHLAHTKGVSQMSPSFFFRLLFP